MQPMARYILERMRKYLKVALIRGPFAVGEGSRIKMGAKIYGGTTIGPYCLATGEIKNSILMSYSNKAHDGYLGDSVIGSWCNLGAGTSNSNLKNTAGMIKMWSKEQNDFVDAGYKCGLLMGDYSRCAINTSFNTGTVVGISCNVFGNVFQSKFINDFTWGSEKYIFEKAISDINNWKKMKGLEITEGGNRITKKNLSNKTKTMRKQIAAANWKMNCTLEQANDLLEGLIKENISITR